MHLVDQNGRLTLELFKDNAHSSTSICFHQEQRFFLSKRRSNKHDQFLLRGDLIILRSESTYLVRHESKLTVGKSSCESVIFENAQRMQDNFLEDIGCMYYIYFCENV